FQVEIRPILTPQFLGSRHGCLHLRTNDARPDFQAADLEFSARIETPRPVLRVVPPEPLRVTSAEPCWVEATLENWGQAPAHLSRKALSPALQLDERPLVPGARDGQPGQARLRIGILPEQLPPGSHSLSVTLRVDKGEPPEVTIPVWVHSQLPSTGES